MTDRKTYLAYRLVALLIAAVCAVVGLMLLLGFMQGTILPAAASGGMVLATNHWGSYLAGLTGALFLVWSILLAATLRDPARGHAIAVASAAGLLLLGFVNLLARFSGEYGEAGGWQKLVTDTFALAALSLIWLSPTEPPSQGD